MSKMSELHAELQEEAWDMGYISLEAALDDGWEVDYEHRKLYKDPMKELDKAHEAWLKERDELLVALENSVRTLERHNYFYDASNIKRAIKFIKEECHD